MTDTQALEKPESQSAGGTIDDDRLGELHLQLLQDLFDDKELNVAQKRLESGDVYDAMHDLFGELQDRRNDSSDQEWEDYVRLCRTHPVCKLIHQDPFTARAYNKPRGYAGDAVMMDMIYSVEGFRPGDAHALPKETTELGMEIFRYTSQAPAAAAVQARRDSVANMLDELVANIREPHVLSIAAGHFREAELARCVKRQKLGRTVCLDSDAESLNEIEQSYGRFGVEIVPASIRRLLTGDLEMGTFDFVYSTGLFDYLRANVGQRLVERMFEMLKPDGKLMVANFLPQIRDIGYMEAFMGWDLIYRSRAEMMGLTMNIPQEQIRDVRVYSEENTNILFLEVTRQH